MWQANSWSQANGALMRILPLAIWGHRLSDEELAFCAHQDAILSHPHENCQVQPHSPWQTFKGL